MTASLRGQALCLLLVCSWIVGMQAQAFTPIRTCLELQAMEEDLDASYELVQDIDCTETATWNNGEGFYPIGTKKLFAPQFTGVLLGNYHVIFNLTINRPTFDRSTGLFGYTEGAQIQAVGLKGANIIGNERVGGIVGRFAGSFTDNFIENSSVSGANRVGGVIGSQGDSVANSYAEKVQVKALDRVGGLVGETSANILNCHSTGMVIGETRVGGLVGRVDFYSLSYSISKVYSTCSVNATGNEVGGLIGELADGSIRSACAMGNVSGVDRVGGLIGDAGFIEIENTYATGEVIGIDSVGGLIGRRFRALYVQGSLLKNSYAANHIVGESNLGGLVGIADDNYDDVLTVRDSYWDVERSRQSTSSGGGHGRLTAQMQQQSNFAGWDFDFIWFMHSGYTYPLLLVHILPPVVESPIPDQMSLISESFSFTVPSGTFVDTEGLLLSHTASLVGGVPLPPWLAFLRDTQTFVGTPLSGAQGVLQISVTACNIPDKCTSTDFTLTLPNRAPTVQSAIPPQTARNGVAFQFIVPEAAFFDVDGDKLVFSAKALDGGPLPVWLQFNSVLGIFSGTATARGTLWVNLTASDGFGGMVSIVFEIVTPNSAPIVTTPYPNQVATLRQPFEFSVPPGSFYDLDNDVLVFSAGLFGGGELLPWIAFGPETLTFSGTSESVGFLMLAVIATDPFNATASLSFGLTISEIAGNHPPILAIKIPAQTAYTKRDFTFTFAEGTFEDPDGGVLRYSATLEGGGALPEWLYFNNVTRTFSGVPELAKVLRITVRATDPEGAYALDTFTLTIEDTTNQPPIVKNSIASQVAQVDQPFSLSVRETFADNNNDPLNVTVSRAGGRPLPGWLDYNSTQQLFSGKPSMWDTNFYADRQYTIEVRASDGQASVVETFYLFVEGESFWELFIKAGAPIGTVLSVLFAGYRYYDVLWNWFCGRWYRTRRQIAKEGEDYSFTLRSLSQLKNKKIERAQVFINGDRLPNQQLLPEWLKDSTLETLSGTPRESDVGIITVRVYGYDGRILAEFELRIYQVTEESDAKNWRKAGPQVNNRKRRHFAMSALRGGSGTGGGGDADEELLD